MFLIKSELLELKIKIEITNLQKNELVFSLKINTAKTLYSE